MNTTVDKAISAARITRLLASSAQPLFVEHVVRVRVPAAPRLLRFRRTTRVNRRRKGRTCGGPAQGLMAEREKHAGTCHRTNRIRQAPGTRARLLEGAGSETNTAGT